MEIGKHETAQASVRVARFGKRALHRAKLGRSMLRPLHTARSGCATSPLRLCVQCAGDTFWGMGQPRHDVGLITAITPDVMKCLAKWKFFERLDDRLCPADESRPAESCRGNYEISKDILRSAGVDKTDLEDIFGVLQAQGGYCDCEILFNVSESNRLKAKYWRSRAAGLEPPTRH